MLATYMSQMFHFISFILFKVANLTYAYFLRITSSYSLYCYIRHHYYWATTHGNNDWSNTNVNISCHSSNIKNKSNVSLKGWNWGGHQHRCFYFEGRHLLLPVCFCLPLCVLTWFLSPVCAPQAPAGSRGPRPAEQTPPSLIDWWENNRAAVMEAASADRQPGRVTGAHTGIQRPDSPGVEGRNGGVRIVQFHN